MEKFLIVVDMQNDFIDGSLGTPEAQAIVHRVAEKIKSFDGDVIVTQDTHDENYLETQEGKKLPVPHCLRRSGGWQIQRDVADALAHRRAYYINKKSFASKKLLDYICDDDSIELIGVCTDICVVSNALLLKAFFPEATITVDASCCAGSTPEAHEAALAVMRSCQIDVIG